MYALLLSDLGQTGPSHSTTGSLAARMRGLCGAEQKRNKATGSKRKLTNTRVVSDPRLYSTDSKHVST